MSPARCTIAVAVWNKPDLTARCLESILANTTDVDYEGLLLDDASDEPGRKFLEAFAAAHPHFRIHRFSSNGGYLRSANHAVATLRTPYLCLLNNDTVVTPGWLSECLSVLESEPGLGIVSPTTNETGREFAERHRSGQTARSKGQWIEVNNAMGSCYVMKKTVVDAVGSFDEAFGKGYFEEVDYGLRARRAGFGSAMALGAYIWHQSGATFGDIAGERNDLWHKNRALLESRWGKPKRVLFFAGGKRTVPQFDRLKALLLERCRRREIIDFYYHGDAGGIEGAHFNIRTKKAFWRHPLALRVILAAKKKKPYDEVVTDLPLKASWAEKSGVSVTRIEG